MPCFHPLPAYRSPSGTVTIGWQKSAEDAPFRVPCGGCDGCRVERARQWAVRCMHEASRHDDNAFATLTYSDEYLPAGGSLDKRALQLFFKRLRKAISPRRVRYYAVGEYGSQFGRPHYHALLFGYDFSDKVRLQERGGSTVWSSHSLAELWPYGLHELGSVTFASASYCAQYMVGKARKPVLGVDADGVATELEPEFSVMSRRPGVGADWLDTFGDEVYRTDGVVVNGKLSRPPRYYDTRFRDLHDEPAFEEVRLARLKKLVPQNLAAAEVLLKARLKLNRREFE